MSQAHFPLHWVAVQLCTHHTPPLANYLTKKRIPQSPDSLLAPIHQKANLVNQLVFEGTWKHGFSLSHSTRPVKWHCHREMLKKRIVWSGKDSRNKWWRQCEYNCRIRGLQQGDTERHQKNKSLVRNLKLTLMLTWEILKNNTSMSIWYQNISKERDRSSEHVYLFLVTNVYLVPVHLLPLTFVQ